MATITAGTLTTSTLTALQWYPGIQVTDATDLSTVKEGVMRDPGQPLGSVWGNASGPVDSAGNKVPTIQPDAINGAGVLKFPGREGYLCLQPGDTVANDQFGNLIFIPARALPKTLTASITLVSASNTATSATDIRTYGWQVGTHVTSSHTPAGTVIGTIAADGKSFTLVAFSTGNAANATGSATETMTAGTFTHS